MKKEISLTKDMDAKYKTNIQKIQRACQILTETDSNISKIAKNIYI
jgi:hypothetical protein